MIFVACVLKIVSESPSVEHWVRAVLKLTLPLVVITVYILPEICIIHVELLEGSFTCLSSRRCRKLWHWPLQIAM